MMTDDEARYRELASHAMVLAARQLRLAQTSAEERLWACLRNRRLAGIKFRRQHPVSSTRFIVDFFCYEAGLIVELDGEVHRYQYEADLERQCILETEGYRVLRFSNDAVWKNLSSVVEAIAKAVDEQFQRH